MRFVFSAFIRYYEILREIDYIISDTSKTLKNLNKEIKDEALDKMHEEIKNLKGEYSLLSNSYANTGGIKNILASKHYPEQVVRAVDYGKDVEGVNLIIDSGAFSVWNMGGKLDVNEYITFLKEFERDHMSKFNEVWFVNLDVIPGVSGQKVITHQDIRNAADEGFENYLKLRNEGWDNVIHVFHQGEPMDVLDRLLQTDPEYIGISPSNDSMTKARIDWLTQSFNYIEKTKGYVKTHGFAVTSMNLMSRFPWFSVDSTSWFMIGMYGKLCIPVDENKQIILDPQAPVFDKFEVSTSVRKINGVDGYNTIYRSDPERAKQIDKYMIHLYDLYGIHPEQLCSERNEARVAANLLMFLRFEKQPKPEIHKPISMFG